MDGLGALIVSGLVGIAVAIILGIVLIVGLFLPDKIKSHKPLTPTIIIETKNVNGIITSDTTYVYKK